jgi:hypothetical protein
MEVLFYDPNLNERGTSVAVYDYARYNEELLGNKSTIISLKSAELSSLNKFKNRFDTILVDSINDIYKTPCDYFHVLKYGHNDGVLHPEAKNLIHTVFPSYEPHGDVYAYISEWLAKAHGNGSPFVPHMIDLPNIEGNYKSLFNAQNKMVVGWYGGNNFEIPFARQVVIDVARHRKDILFIFMNQQPFCSEPNVLFMEGTTNVEDKVKFINTCDIMIHARERGETFGLAIAEFSTMNKPVITYKDSPERCHIELLGEKGIYYSTPNDLYNILTTIQKYDIEGRYWNCYQEFTPQKVINQFNKVFLS